MDKNQIQAACNYINANIRQINGFDEKVDIAKQVGPDITPDDVVKASERRDKIVLLVNRGIKGTPKYTLNSGDVQQFIDQQKASVKVISSKTENKLSAKGTTKAHVKTGDK